MGLKFCNEAIIALEEIWPARKEEIMPLSPLQVGSSTKIKVKMKKYSRSRLNTFKCDILSHAIFVSEYISGCHIVLAHWY